MALPRFFKTLAAAALALAALLPAAANAEMQAAIPGQNGYGIPPTALGLPGSSHPQGGTNWQLTFLNNVVKRGLQIISGLSVVVLVWAGVLYVTSFGEEDKVKKAKKTVLWTILGLFTGLGGWAVIDLVNSIKLN